VKLLLLLFWSIAVFGQSASPSPETKSDNSADSASEHKQQSSGETSQKNPFKKYTGSMSAGSAIQKATQAAAARHPRELGQLDVLSDTQGVDLGPYLKGILTTVRQNWYKLIPESARMERGRLAIEFAINKDGQVADMHLAASSGDVALDRPAWGSITNSSPFPALPAEFKGKHLALRFRYYYNPDKSDLNGGTSTSGKADTGASATKSKSGIVVSISAPGSLQIPTGGSQVVTATVTGTEEKVVEWSVTGSSCSGSACGTMIGDLYVAPSVVPSLPYVTLTAGAKADPTSKASVTFHIVQPSQPR
jgi:TonB family protein